MILDYLIIEEIKRRKERSWEPEPLQLPLYIPHAPPDPREKEEEDNDHVIIIDM